MAEDAIKKCVKEQEGGARFMVGGDDILVKDKKLVILYKKIK